MERDMNSQQKLLVELKKQRRLLDELMTTIAEARRLDAVSSTYDQTTRAIEKNLLDIRKSFFKTN
jgi:hypothetical protein